MATINITWPTGTSAGSGIRKLARMIEAAAIDVPDHVSSGGDTTLRISDSVENATASVQVKGPYGGDVHLV